MKNIVIENHIDGTKIKIPVNKQGLEDMQTLYTGNGFFSQFSSLQEGIQGFIDYVSNGHLTATLEDSEGALETTDMAKNMPRISVPKEKGISSRPDQQVYPAGMSQRKDYLEHKIMDAYMKDPNQHSEKVQAFKHARQMSNSYHGDEPSKIGGVFYPARDRDGFAVSTNSDHVKEHEGFHVLADQIYRKHGIEEKNKYLDTLVSAIPENLRNKIDHRLGQIEGYRRMRNHYNPFFNASYKEEMINHLRDWNTSKAYRSHTKQSFGVDENGKNPDNPFKEAQYRDFDNHLKSSWKNVVNASKNYKFDKKQS